MDQLLQLIGKHAELSDEALAAMVGQTAEAVAAQRKQLEQAGVIRGYRAVIDWDKTEHTDEVTALIEIKVSPKAAQGFDEIAGRIMQLDEVESLWLVSGGFDLCAIVKGKSLKEIAYFVSGKLGVMDSVLSCSTHFLLKAYKDSGFSFFEEAEDLREQMQGE